MPQRWLVRIEHPAPERVEPHHLHALVSRWLDEDHWADRKPYALVPLYVADDGHPAFEVGLLVDDLARCIGEGVAELHRRGGRLGSLRCRALEVHPELVAAADWGAVWEQAEPQRDLSLQFETPTTFREGALYHPVPTPSSAVRSWNERWQRFAPPLLARAVDLDASSCKITVAHLEGRTVETVRGRRTIPGFVGAVTFRSHDRGDERDVVRRRLRALAGIAPFGGTGSGTPSGFGVTTVGG